MEAARQDIARVEPGETSVPAVSETSAIVSMIERAASNPAVDIEKMERLLQMQERVMARRSEVAYSSALAKMQPELPVIGERGGIKDRSGNVQSTYALWEDINEAIKPVLSKHGFALTFQCGREDGQIVVTGVLRHSEGHKEQTTIHLPLDTSGSKNNVQAVGSSTSYGQRYTARALLNLTSRFAEDRDDDGRKGGGPATITDEEAERVRSLLTETKSDVGLFLEFFRVECVPDLPAARLNEAIRKLEAKRSRR